MHRLLALLFPACLLGITACAPCAGTSTCHTENRVSYSGHMVKFLSSDPAPPTELMFVRTGGVSLGNDTIRATTAADGFFTIGGRALGDGVVVGTLHVAPAGYLAFDIPNLQLQTSNRAGDGGTFGRIVVDPYLLQKIQIVDPATGNGLAVPSLVTFRRTGGIKASPDVVTVSVGTDGSFHLAPVPVGTGVILGELTIEIPDWQVTYKAPLTMETRVYDVPPYDWTNIVLPAR